MKKMTDRKVLFNILLEYLEAITNNEITRLPLSSQVKVTENGIPMKIAASCIWGAPRRISCRQSYVDPITGSAVFFGVITNTTTIHSGSKAKWWLYVVRLKIENEIITEIEEIITDNIFAHYEKNPWEIVPDLSFDCILPDDEIETREELVAAVEKYWDGVERSIDGYAIPFHPDAVRRECGTVTTDAKNFPNSARGDFIKANNEGWRWNVINRRYPIVDQKRGVVISIADLKTSELTNANFLPCIVAEVFKIECGLIKTLNAIFYSGENSSAWQNI